MSHIGPGPQEESEEFIRRIYASLTSLPTATARLVVDTDVASFIFKWHPEFAPRYVDVLRGSELVISFMTMAEMRQGALDGNEPSSARATSALIRKPKSRR